MRKKYDMTFTLSEILKDISNANYLNGEAIADENLARLRTLLQDVAEDGYKERAVRAIVLAMGDVRDKLFDYLDPQNINEQNEQLWDSENYGVTATMGNTYYEPTELKLTLQLPANCPYVQGEYIRNLVHDYIVKKTIAEYASFSADYAAEWGKKAEVILDKLDVAVNRRVMVKRAMSTF